MSKDMLRTGLLVVLTAFLGFAIASIIGGLALWRGDDGLVRVEVGVWLALPCFALMPAGMTMVALHLGYLGEPRPWTRVWAMLFIFLGVIGFLGTIIYLLQLDVIIVSPWIPEGESFLVPLRQFLSGEEVELRIGSAGVLLSGLFVLMVTIWLSHMGVTKMLEPLVHWISRGFSLHILKLGTGFTVMMTSLQLYKVDSHLMVNVLHYGTLVFLGFMTAGYLVYAAAVLYIILRMDHIKDEIRKRTPGYVAISGYDYD